jgi:GDPmannose 4,6-dehydratase
LLRPGQPRPQPVNFKPCDAVQLLHLRTSSSFNFTRQRQELVLGDLTVERDWGWASEYVIALHGMLQADQPEDLVIATGVSASLETFVAEAFSRLGLDWRRHVVHDERLVRRGEARCLRTDPGRAAERIGWRAKSTICDVARMMVDARSAEAGQTLKRAA